MKILFLGDHSNIHACLAAELRRLGHRITLVSDGYSHRHYKADITLKRSQGRINSFRYLYDIMSALPAMVEFDVVQIINSDFLSLSPGRTRYFFDQIRHRNRSVFLTLAKEDYFYTKCCIDGGNLKFSEYRVGNERTRFSKLFPRYEKHLMRNANASYTKHVYDVVDGAMSLLPVYDLASRPFLEDKLTFTDLPVDLSTIAFNPVTPGDKISLLVNINNDRNRDVREGTEDLAHIAKELEAEYPDRCETTITENLKEEEFLIRIPEADIILDRLYSFSPSKNALLAMASGKAVAMGIAPEYYESNGEQIQRALIPLSPLADNKETLRRYILDPSSLHDMAANGRKFVENRNDVTKIAPKFIERWEKFLTTKND